MGTGAHRAAHARTNSVPILCFINLNLPLFTYKNRCRLPIDGESVETRGSLADVLRINLHSRLAGRVLLQLDTFVARDFGGLMLQLKKIPFEKFVDPSLPVSIKVQSYRSDIYHEGAIKERAISAISTRLAQR